MPETEQQQQQAAPPVETFEPVDDSADAHTFDGPEKPSRTLAELADEKPLPNDAAAGIAAHRAAQEAQAAAVHALVTSDPAPDPIEGRVFAPHFDHETGKTILAPLDPEARDRAVEAHRAAVKAGQADAAAYVAANPDAPRSAI